MKQRSGAPSLLTSLEEELAPVLAGSRWGTVSDEARALEDAVRAAVARTGTRSVDVRCECDGGDVVVHAPNGPVRLWRQAVTGWWLSQNAYSPERTARAVAAALVVADPPSS